MASRPAPVINARPLAGRTLAGQAALGTLTPALALFLILTGYFVLRALAVNENHDEGQYLAAALLSQTKLIFRDFLSLQVPLHAWVYAVVAAPFTGATFLAMRIATALSGVASLALLHLGLRRSGTSPSAALVAVAAMAGCGGFQFSAAVIRNDMLPTGLLTAALWLALDRSRGETMRGVVQGVLLGLAISAKISFAPAGAAVLLWAMLDREVTRGAALRLAAGIVVGMVPALVAFALAPAAFLHGVFGYAANAPYEWYRANGRGEQLGLYHKLYACLRVLRGGPTLVAIGLVAVRLAPRDRDDRLLLAAAGGGLLGFLGPTPTHVQYVLPLLPPLFFLFGRQLDRLTPAAPQARTLVLVATALLAVVGSVKPVSQLVRATRSGFGAVRVTEIAHEMRAVIREDGRPGTIASLSPDRAADAGLPLDPRFATGPFVYRSGGTIKMRVADAFNVVTPATLARSLDRAPPLAVVTGYDSRSATFRIDAEATVVAYLERHAWREVPLSDGLGILWLRPR